MKKIALIFLLTFSFLSFSQNKYNLSNYGIELIFVTENNMFPQNWYGGNVNAFTTSLNKEEQNRSLKIIQKTLSKYPADFIKKHLQKIYVLHTLEFFNQKFGGTYSVEKNAVYLSNKGVNLGYTDSYIEEVFHAEFSSILFHTYSHLFPKEEWIKSSLVKHGNSGVTALKNGTANTDFVEEYHIKGFLDQYSMSSIENDFNCFAKNIFCNQLFWGRTEKYILLRQKKELTILFYQRIDTQFNESFFKKVN